MNLDTAQSVPGCGVSEEVVETACCRLPHPWVRSAFAHPEAESDRCSHRQSAQLSRSVCCRLHLTARVKFSEIEYAIDYAELAQTMKEISTYLADAVLAKLPP